MMAAKQPNEAEKTWLDVRGEPIRVDMDAVDRQLSVSRRTQALLAAAGEVGSDRAWFVIKVKPNRENDVDKSLSAHLIDHWLPMVKADRMSDGRRTGVAGQPFWVLAWPGYVFVRMRNVATAWAGLATVKHVIAALGVGEQAFRVSDDMLLKIKAELATLKAVRKNADTLFVKDEKVMVTDGPFAKFPGIIEEIGTGLHEGRARVEVMIFGRAVPVDLQLDQLAKQ